MYERNRDELLQYISRCVVCESIFKMVVVHSMTNEIPECKEGFVPAASPNRNYDYEFEGQEGEQEWVGYSFWENNIDKYSLGLITDKPASCLLHYTPTAVGECNIEGCNFHTGKSNTGWLMDHNTETDKLDKKQEPFE